MEERQNRKETKRSLGTVLKYGMVIQLLHVKSDKYLCAQRRHPAMLERSGTRVQLERQPLGGAWFQVLPYFKLRSEGVCAGPS